MTPIPIAIFRIQTQNPILKITREKKQQRDAAAPRDKAEGDEGSEGWPPDKDEFGPAPGSTRAPETKGMSISLERLKAACPQFENYAKAGISSWRDAVVTAGLVRSMLGMSPDAWERARLAMGEAGATVAVAAILERAGEIRSPGGYLRALTMRAGRKILGAADDPGAREPIADGTDGAAPLMLAGGLT